MMILAFKNMMRAGGVKTGLLFLLTAGIVSLLVGKQFIDRQRETVAEILDYQKVDFDRSARAYPDEMGLLLYYLKFSLINNPLPISSLSIGQRDVNTAVQRVTIRGLEAQKYDADLNNPANLLLGNLDASFVLIYLFPLFIIAFTYNIISEEQESGTWRIVLVQSTSAFGHVGRLFAIRVLLILGMWVGLLVLAVLWLGIPPDGVFVGFLGVSVLYLLFWLGVSFWVASLQQRSSVNAMLLVGIWISLIILLPAVVNNYIVARYPVPEALETTLKQRKAYHEKWDMDKKGTMDAFYAHYPQFRRFPLPDGEFNWLWYYAMQQAGDDESAPQARALRAKLQQRETASRQLARFVPTLHAQLQLNELARSGFGNQLRFLDRTSRFHEQKRLYFYPKIVSNAPVRGENWAAIGVETFDDTAPIRYADVFVPLLLFAGLFTALGWVNFRRNLYRLYPTDHLLSCSKPFT